MRLIPSHALLGPALLLYLLAGAAAAQGVLDPAFAWVAGISALLSLTPALLGHRRELTGSLRAGWLGLTSAGALLVPAAPHALSIAVEATWGVFVAASGGLVLDLALSVPDEVGTPSRARWLRALSRSGAVLAALTGLAAGAPAVHALGMVWFVPSRVAYVPVAFLGVALVTALALRFARRRLGSSPESLASNAWALIGLVPAVALACVLAVFYATSQSLDTPVVRESVALAAVLLVWSHARLIDPRSRLSVGPTTREIVAGVLTLVALSALALLSRPWWPTAPLALAVGVGAGLLFGTALHRGVRALVFRALTPGSGHLLSALARGRDELGHCSDLLAVARVALGTARDASASPSAEPLLYLFDPPRTIRCDAAGEPHFSESQPHPELLAALRARPGELLLRAALEARLVRTPAERPLIEALVGLDALCVLPLMQRGELEGALIVPRGRRRAALALEELEALQELAAHLTGFLAVLCADARAQHRAEQAFAHGRSQHADLTRTRTELARAHAELALLRSAASARRSEGPPAAYGPAMRALIAQLKRSAELSEPVLLWGERGLELEALAQLLHEHSARAGQPFVVIDCSATRSEAQVDALLGSAQAPGWLDLAGRGTLVLRELPALGSDAQQALSAALAARRTCVVATARSAPDALCTEGALQHELRGRFRACLRVPALRERGEDLPSLLLLALARSARVLGKPPVGLEPEAQARLVAYDWPGNLDELDSVIEQAVARSRGPRVSSEDLPQLGASAAPAPGNNPLDASYDRVERRVLRRALERAGGNKSEAARLLGLKRTTFLDKLRRFGLEPSASEPDKDAPDPSNLN